MATAQKPEGSQNDDGFWSAKITDWAVAALTAGLLLVGFIQARIYRNQARLMLSALKATGRANRVAARNARAAEDAVKKSGELLTHAQDTAQHQLRAYIGLERAFLGHRGDGVFIDLAVTFKNFGSTPATNINIEIQTGVETNNGQVWGEWQSRPAVDLPPTQFGTSEVELYGLNDATREVILTGNASVVARVRWKYSDLYGRIWSGGFDADTTGQTFRFGRIGIHKQVAETLLREKDN